MQLDENTDEVRRIWRGQNMIINKLGLVSMIAVLSVTTLLGGCDLLKSPEQIKAEKIARLERVWEEKYRKSDEAQSKLDEISPKFWKIVKEINDMILKQGRSESDVLEYEQSVGFEKIREEYWEADRENDEAFYESCDAWNALRPYLTGEFDD